MDCLACGHRNRDSARFCDTCGRPLATAAAQRPVADPRSYTPKHLAEKILHSKTALEGERKQVTVLFADVKGSMELAEGLDPEEWHAVLDRFFQLLADGVHRFEGTINQYTGDGIMALFGAPIAHEDHALRACHAAHQLRDVLARYADELRLSRGINLSVRMGMNSGEVVVGKIGDDLRMDYTASGHTVGLAQRMEQIAESGHAYLTERTAALVEGFFELRDLGVAPVKGSREPVRVYALDEPGPLHTRFALSRARGLSKFVGRAEPLRRLESALDAATRGEGRVVGVVAEPGMGKSRLCYELCERARARGIAVYEAHGLSHGRQMPMLPILELVRSFFGIAGGDSDRAARERMAASLERLGDELRDELPLLADFMGVADPAPAFEPIDPEAYHARIVRALQRTLFASRAPAVLLIEDLHWFDAASDGILAQIVAAAAGSSRLVIVNFRPEYAAPWREAAHYEHLALRRLASEDVRELLDGLLGGDPSVARLPERIEARTGGNPFFVEEVVRMLADDGTLVGSRGAWRLSRPVGAIDVPDSVRSVLAARADRLRDREKHVLRCAAVIGNRVPRRLLARVADLPERELEAAIARLLECEFLREARLTPEVEYEFRHPLTQEVTYEAQLRGPRASAHAAVARAIEELSRDRLEEQAARLAHHWEAADDALEAARWHKRAAEWIGLAEPAEALRHWRRVRQLASRPGSRIGAELLAFACHQTLNLGWRLGLPDDEMRRAVAQCRENAGQVEPAQIVRVLCAYTACQRSRGEIEDNVEPLLQSLRIARAQRSADMEIDVLLTLQESMRLLGRLAEAERFCTRVIELVDRNAAHANFAGTGSCVESLATRALVRAERGQHDKALADVELALRLADEQAHDENRLIALRAAVLAAELSGAAQASLPRARRLARIALASGSPLRTLDAALCTGVAYAGSSQWQQSIGPLEQVIERIDERGFARPDLGAALAVLARAYLGTGRPGDAVRAAERAVRVTRSSGMKSQESLARIALARAWLAAEGRAASRKIRAGLSRAEALADETGARALRPFVCEARADLATAREDPAAAERERRAAHRLFAATGASGHADRISRQLAGSPPAPRLARPHPIR